MPKARKFQDLPAQTRRHELFVAKKMTGDLKRVRHQVSTRSYQARSIESSSARRNATEPGPVHEQVFYNTNKRNQPTWFSSTVDCLLKKKFWNESEQSAGQAAPFLISLFVWLIDLRGRPPSHEKGAQGQVKEQQNCLW